VRAMSAGRQKFKKLTSGMEPKLGHTPWGRGASAASVIAAAQVWKGIMLSQIADKNALLSELSPAEYGALRSHLAPLELRVGQCLHYLGDPVEEVVFPNSGLIAMTLPLRDNPGAAAALIGRDGIVGAVAALATAPAASDAVVQISGQASRMSAAAFRHVLDENPSIRWRVARCAYALIAQLQQTALCHAAHPVESRICRWLLAIQGRCAGDRVPLTQSTLAQMLGVRRTTVTLVAGRLEAAGVLKCHRGYMQIVNQDELERRCCECHAHFDGYINKLSAGSAEAAPLPDHPARAIPTSRLVI
jgi:CRP-like cAMP-binding protein